MIVKRKEGYFVLSETLRPPAGGSGRATRRNLGGPASTRLASRRSGRRLGGPYQTREEAVKRLRQVEYFKYLKKK